MIANDKTMYVASYNSNTLFKVLPPESLTGTPTVSSIGLSNSGFNYGCKGYDGKFYGFSDTMIMIWDPTSLTASYISHGRSSGVGRWGGAVQAANGKIYLTPGYGATISMVFDPTTATTSIITTSTAVTDGYVPTLAQDGNVYGVRRNAPSSAITNFVYRINTSNDTAIITGTVTAPIDGDVPAVVLGADGKIYALQRGPQSTGTNMSLFRVSIPSMAVETVAVNVAYRTNDINWWGARLHKDGNIWIPFANYRNDNVLRWLKIPTSSTVLNLSDNQLLGKPVNRFTQYI
jgi:hypothetical protein